MKEALAKTAVEIIEMTILIIIAWFVLSLLVGVYEDAKDEVNRHKEKRK